MSLTLLFAGTGRAADTPTGVILLSLIVSPSPGVTWFGVSSISMPSSTMYLV